MKPIAVLLALLVCATPASAATVTARDTTESDSHTTYHVRNVEFTAAPGEVNRLEVTWVARRGMRLHDPVGISVSAPCVAEDAQTVLCPSIGGYGLTVDLGDGDDTMTASIAALARGGEGNDAIELLMGLADGGPGADTLTVKQYSAVVRGGPGADVLSADKLDFTDLAAGVNVDLVAGTATSAGEVDRLAPGTRLLDTGPGPDVIRGADRGLWIESGAGNDVIDGSSQGDIVTAGPGDDVVRGNGGDDRLHGAGGDDRLEGGDGEDFLNGDGIGWLTQVGGNDVLDGGAGRDELYGEDGRDLLLARDGEADRVGCADERSAADGFAGDRAVVDPGDNTSWCEHVTGARGLVLHGLTRSAMVVSCSARRVCTGRVRVIGGRAAQRLRVGAGRRVRVPVTRTRDRFSVRILTPTNAVLRARLYAARR